MCKLMRAVLPILDLLCQLQVQRRALTRRAQGLGSDDPSVTVFHESPASASTPSPSGGGRLHASLQGVAESPPLGKHAPQQLLVPRCLAPALLSLSCSCLLFLVFSTHTYLLARTHTHTHKPARTHTHTYAYSHTNAYTIYSHMYVTHMCV